METKTKPENWVFIEATPENIDKAINSIVEFARQKGYQIKGDLNRGTFRSILDSLMGIEFSSKGQEKTVRHYLTRLNKKITLRQSNRFLNLLYKGVYEADKAPHVDLSEKELKIKAARKLWKETQQKADEFLKQYKEEKGNFYKH